MPGSEPAWPPFRVDQAHRQPATGPVEHIRPLVDVRVERDGHPAQLPLLALHQLAQVPDDRRYRANNLSTGSQPCRHGGPGKSIADSRLSVAVETWTKSLSISTPTHPRGGHRHPGVNATRAIR